MIKISTCRTNVYVSKIFYNSMNDKYNERIIEGLGEELVEKYP